MISVKLSPRDKAIPSKYLFKMFKTYNFNI